MMKLSNTAYKITGQPMFKTLERVSKLNDIVHFELGDPDFNTPKNIIDATVTALYKGDTHYTNSMGLKEMREAVRYTTNRTRSFIPDLEQILITPGANIIIYLVMQCLLNPKDEVLVPNPGFPTYFSVAKMLNVNAISVPLKEENNFRLNPKDVAKRITNKTKLIIINSPSNPTGSVMLPEEIDEVYSIASKRSIFILSDEIYSRMIYDMKFHSPSMNDYCRKYTIVLNGFSKAFAMTGWRLGVAIGPKKIIAKMGLLIQTLCSCVPPFIQRGGVSAIMGSQNMVDEMMYKYAIRRNYIVDSLNTLRGIYCLKPEGSFYVFPNVKETSMTSREFSNWALKQGVALLPGTDFGKYGEGYVRMSYATGVDNIRKGIERLYEGLRLHH